MKNSKLIIACLVLLSFVVVGISFSFLNEIIPIHLGLDGKPDQFGSKYFVLLFPLVITLVSIAILLVDKYGKSSDNYKENLLKTCLKVDGILFGVEVVFIIYAALYSENSVFDVSKVILPLIGLSLVSIGNYMPKIMKNKTLGVKTYWSMYNDVTWQKTHRLAGFVFVVSGLLVIILSLFFKDVVNFIILMVVLLIALIITTVASYIYYKEEKGKE